MRTVAMESPSQRRDSVKEKLLDKDDKNGGLRTLPYIIANDAMEKVVSYGVVPNMTLYLMGEYHISLTTATKMLYIWSAATSLAPVIGAFLTDSYLGRFWAVGFGSISCLLGMFLLWLTAMIPQARPLACNAQSSMPCESPSFVQLLFLCTSFALLSIGAGGLRSSAKAFGADQLNNKGKPDSRMTLESFFRWYYVFTSISVLTALTCIVYIQQEFGWKVGFGIPVILMGLSVLSFFLASPIYVKRKAQRNLISSFAQVACASYRNRHIKLFSTSRSGKYRYKEGVDQLSPSDRIRFLNKACVYAPIEKGETQTADDAVSGHTIVCTVDQVEEVKALIRVIPIWSTGIMVPLTIGQNSFMLVQANSMDRHITSNFEIPAGSFNAFLIITLILWLSIYNRILTPLISRISPTARLGVKPRMAVGVFLTVVKMAVLALIESARRKAAIEQGLEDDPQATVNISAMWLIPQYALGGLILAFYEVAQNEFYYNELPKSMSSIAGSLPELASATGNVIATWMVSAVDDVTGRGGNVSWVASNINRGHFDYFCWLAAGLSFANFVYYIACCSAYGPCRVVGEEVKVKDDEEEPFAP